MAEPIYNRANLRKQVVDLLQAEKRAMTPGAISLKLHLPFWAVQSGLELALREKLVEFTAGPGYRIVPVTPLDYV